MKICALQSDLSREVVLQNLAPSGLRGIVRGLFTGKLYALAEVYLPYRLYKIKIADRRIHKPRYYAIDAASGNLDPYEFAAPPGPEDIIEIDTRNAHPILLNEGRTSQLALESIRRSLFSGGFFRLADPKLTADLIHDGLFIPYWAAFYGYEQNLRITVLNSIRQMKEGSKVRQLIQKWLLEHGDAMESPHVYADARRAANCK